MAAKGGAEHHNVVRLREDKSKVIAHVETGIEVRAAIAMVGRKPDVLKKWLTDPVFAKNLEIARTAGSDLMKVTLGSDNGKNIDFATFSKEFLGNEVFPHQQDWIDVVEGKEPSWLHPSMSYEKGNKNRILINVPPEHAKSTVITVGYSTYRIAMDSNVRIIVVSKTLTKAREFVYSIKQRLSHPRYAKLQQVYGPSGGWKEDSDTWKTDTVYLGQEARDSSEKDPTLQALGIGGQIYGARADLIILDDVITTANAHEWEKQLDWLQKEVITRLGKNGKLLIVGTRIGAVDLYRELRNPEHWSGGASPFTRLAMPAALEVHDDPKKWVTLWERSDRPWDGDDDAVPDEDGYYQKWDGPALFSRRSEVTASTWALVYQQQDIDDDAIFNPTIVNACVNRMRKPGPLRVGAAGHPRDGQWVTLIGMDPAMAGKTALVVYAVDRQSGKRLVLDAYNMSDPTPGKIRAIIEDWINTYRPVELRIEINAHQKMYEVDEEFRQYLANKGVRFSSHFTGKNKWDTDFGVAAMQGLFGTMGGAKHNRDNLIELPDPQYHEGIKALINQLITWKPGTRNPTDVVMALWFCEIKAKEMIQHSGTQIYHATSRFVTQRQMAKQAVVNLDDLAMEQHTTYL
jgi:hypothetical protein